MHLLNADEFSEKKYLGRWYQIAHYPSFFEGSATWNTTATYRKKNGYISVKNSTYRNTEKVSVKGKAVPQGRRSFHVSFPGFPDPNPSEPNYLIESIWVDSRGDYLYAVVTSPARNNLFVLSRSASPNISEIEQVMKVVFGTFDVSRIVMTPHYT